MAESKQFRLMMSEKTIKFMEILEELEKFIQEYPPKDREELKFIVYMIVSKLENKKSKEK